MRTTDRYAALNRRARHESLIEVKLEAGLVLHGTEVKSLRQGGASIAEAYADEQGGELFLVNANIPEYEASVHFNERGRAKVELGLATGKRKSDKRQAERDRDWQRSRARLMRSREL